MKLHGHNSLSDAVTRMEAVYRDTRTERLQLKTLSRMFQFRECLNDLQETLRAIDPEEERIHCHIRLINMLRKWKPSLEDLLNEIQPNCRELLGDESLRKLKMKVQEAAR
jgi:hypothetical protein